MGGKTEGKAIPSLPHPGHDKVLHQRLLVHEPPGPVREENSPGLRAHVSFRIPTFPLKCGSSTPADLTRASRVEARKVIFMKDMLPSGLVFGVGRFRVPQGPRLGHSCPTPGPGQPGPGALSPGWVPGRTPCPAGPQERTSRSLVSFCIRTGCTCI